jgi:hypothetical protein
MLKLVAVTLLEQFDTISEASQSYKPFYPRGKDKIRTPSDLTADAFYFSVPEDLLRYGSFTARRPSLSHQHE